MNNSLPTRGVTSSDLRAMDNPVALSSPIVATLTERVFSPLAQSQLLEFAGLAYHPNSGRKTIKELIDDYGRTPIVAVLQMAILDLARFQGGTAEPQHLMEVTGQCAGLLVSDYHGYKPAEVSYFIARVKRGDYGEQMHFTGAAFMTAWKKFTADRNEERYRFTQEEARRKTRAALSDPANVTDKERLDALTARIIQK